MQTARQNVEEPAIQPVRGAFAAPSKKAIWAGRVISALPVLLLLFAGTMKLMRPPAAVQGFEHAGLPVSLLIPIAMIELSCAIIYAIPRTAVLGAILITGFMGGAVLAHLRIGLPVAMEVLVGVFAWGGLYLRDLRIRELIPLRKR